MIRGRLKVEDAREARLYLSPTSIADAKRIILLSALLQADACEVSVASDYEGHFAVAQSPERLKRTARLAVHFDSPLVEIVFTLKDGVTLDRRLTGGAALPSGLELQEGGAE